MLRLIYGFPIVWYPLFTVVSNTNTLKLHIQLYINRYNTDNYTFT